MTSNTLHQIRRQLNNQQELTYAWFQCMHTRIDIALYGDVSLPFPMIINQIKEELERLEKIVSYYNSESELYNLNQQAHSNPVPVSKELYNMIDLCIKYNTQTCGCFDITIKSPDHHSKKIESIQLYPSKRDIFFKEKDIAIDLSGFAKGYGLDQIKSILYRYEIKNALINMGNSSVLALGNHPYGEGWQVGFSSISSSAKAQNVSLKDEFLTTSGNENDKRKHLICPHTGKYVEGKRQIAVVTKEGTNGEVLSTSLFIATPAQKKQLIDTFHIKQLYEV